MFDENTTLEELKVAATSFCLAALAAVAVVAGFVSLAVLISLWP